VVGDRGGEGMNLSARCAVLGAQVCVRMRLVRAVVCGVRIARMRRGSARRTQVLQVRMRSGMQWWQAAQAQVCVARRVCAYSVRAVQCVCGANARVRGACA